MLKAAFVILAIVFGVAILGITAWALHEAGHLLVWLAARRPIREIVLGAGDVIATRTVTIGGRKLQLTRRKSLLDAAGIAVPREIRANAGPLLRSAVHLAGPAANALVALGAWHLAHGAQGPLCLIATAVWFVHGFYAAVNLLPLPQLDGGWLTTLVIARLRGRDYDWEERWHVDHAMWTWYAHRAIAVAVVVLGLPWALRF